MKVLLDGVVAAVKPKSWPSNLLAFLQGQLDAASLIARANGNGQLTEAHAFVGLAAAIAGRDAEAEPHLKWVIEQGTRTFVEYDLVQGEMKRRRKK